MSGAGGISVQEIETELMRMLQDGLVRVCKTETGEVAYYLTRKAKRAIRKRQEARPG